MKTPCGEPSIRISITITDREHTFRWGRTRRSHERFGRRKWGPSWHCRKSADCTTATNAGLPEKPKSTPLRAAFPRCFEIRLRTVLLEHACIGELRSPDSPRAANCSSFVIRWGNDIRHGLHRVFGRDNLFRAVLVDG